MNFTEFKKKNGDSRVYIRESISVKGKKSKRIVEKYDSTNELNEKYGDWKAFIKQRMTELENERKVQIENKELLKLDFSKKLIDKNGVNNIKNAGYLFLQKIYYDLKIDDYFYKLKSANKMKIQYSLNDAFRLLTFSRVIDPLSKLATSKKIHDYVEDFDLTIDDIYDSLDKFDDIKDKFQTYLYKNAIAISKKPNSVVYYDVTNFYHEISEENKMAAYEVEKNHHPDPITSFGLFMDNNGIPIKYCAYRGNENEKKHIFPEWKNLDKYLDKETSYILCADADLNTSDIKAYLTSSQNHYLFSQSMKMLDSETDAFIFKDENWIDLGKGKNIKKEN